MAENCAFLVDGGVAGGTAVTVARRNFPNQFLHYHRAGQGAVISPQTQRGYTASVHTKLSRVMGASGITMSMMIAQNGLGITNFVTPVKSAYWDLTPFLLVTPQAGSKTIGQGGFQEVPQMAMFEACVCYQEEVRDLTRIPEVLNRVIDKASRGSAPARNNIPRDMGCKESEGAIQRA